MTPLHQTNGNLTAYAKGAPEIILHDCDWLITSNGVVLLDEPGKENLMAVARDMASEALQVLAIAIALQLRPWLALRLEIYQLAR